MEYIHTSKIIKTGSSCCVVIPKAFMGFLELQRGDQVVLTTLETGALYIKKIPQEMLEQLKPVPRITF